MQFLFLAYLNKALIILRQTVPISLIVMNYVIAHRAVAFPVRPFPIRNLLCRRIFARITISFFVSFDLLFCFSLPHSI